MAGFKHPNYTQAPNELFDELMAHMGEAELRVVLVAVRKTLGFHKSYDAISLSQFMQMSGLSRQGVLDGIDAAKGRGLISELDKRGARGVKLYQLVIEPDQSNEQTSTSQASRPVTSQASRPTKETKKKRNKDSAPQADAGDIPSKRKRDPLFDAVQLHIFGIALDQPVEGGRVARISNWLNGKYEGRGAQRVGKISKAADPAHVEQFAAWCKRGGFTPPLDVVKFVEQWRKWATTAAHPKPSAPPPSYFELPPDAHGFGLDQFVRKPVTEGDRV